MDECICNLCDDLVMNILSRVPQKTLVVFKCVSKSWRRLVSNLLHSPTRPRPMTCLFACFFDLRYGLESIEFFNRRDYKIDDDIDVEYRLGFLPCHPETRLVDCRDGLLLCSSKNIGEQDNYFVCNLITRQWVSLPHPPKRTSRSGRLDVNALVLDEESDLCYTHFKVVRFISLYGGNPKRALDAEVDSSMGEDDEESLDDLCVDVYSSRTGKWEESKGSTKGINSAWLDRPAVYVDGVLFLSAAPIHVLMYDVKEEYCKELNFPVDYLDFFAFFSSDCLGNSEGCLHFAYHNGYEMDVWMIEGGDTSRWVLKHSIKLSDIDFPDPSAEEDYVREETVDILAFHPNSDAVFISKQGDFFCYNFNTKAVQTVTCSSATVDKWFLVFPFSDCLVFPFSDCLCPLVDAQQRT